MLAIPPRAACNNKRWEDFPGGMIGGWVVVSVLWDQ
jgi:hypothetical protein